MSHLPRLFAVLGHPIGHSRSPQMHDAAFEALGEPHRYVALDVQPDRLGDALRGAAAMGFGGLNLTVPHKRAAVALVDQVGPRARRIGALNTIVFRRDSIEGHSTDGEGFLRGLHELGMPKTRAAVVLGGGGAARCVVDALLHEGGDDPWSVTWVSRRPGDLPRWAGSTAVAWSGLDQALDGAGLLVNATTVGMRGGPPDFPVGPELRRLAADARVVDLVYPRPSGGLLDAADAVGLPHQDGLAMLLWQGVRAQEHWRGTPLPKAAVEAMRAALG